MLIDQDFPTLTELDSRLFQTETGRIWASPRGHQQLLSFESQVGLILGPTQRVASFRFLHGGGLKSGHNL